jgi:hypothetical protein
MFVLPLFVPFSPSKLRNHWGHVEFYLVDVFTPKTSGGIIGKYGITQIIHA